MAIRNFALQDNSFGEELVQKLIERKKDLKKTPVQIRVILDEFSNTPTSSSEGMVWLNQRLIDAMRAAGIEVFAHSVFPEKPLHEPFFGGLRRVHRKMILADVQKDAQSPPQVVFYGGGRILSGLAFSETKTSPESPMEYLLGVGWGPYRDISYVVRGPLVKEVQETFLQDFEREGGRVTSAERLALLGTDTAHPLSFETAEASASSLVSMRYVSRDRGNQNAFNVLEAFLKGPSKEVNLVNSFIPTDDMTSLMRQAVLKGKTVNVFMGSLWYHHYPREEIAARLIQAGVQVYFVPNEQLHAKLYSDGSHYFTGNQNLDEFSLLDSEDGILFKKNIPLADWADQYFEGLKRKATDLNRLFDPKKYPSLEAHTKAVNVWVRSNPPLIKDNPKTGDPKIRKHTFGEIIAYFGPLAWEKLVKGYIRDALRISREAREKREKEERERGNQSASIKKS